MHMDSHSLLCLPVPRVLKVPFRLSRGGVVAAVRNNWQFVVVGLAVAAEDEQADVLVFVEKDKFVRVQSLPQEYRA